MRSSNEVDIELKARIGLQKSTTHNQAALYILVLLYFELKQKMKKKSSESTSNISLIFFNNAPQCQIWMVE